MVRASDKGSGCVTEARKGVLAMVATATIWGLSTIYYKALSNVPPIEVLSHRTLWSAVFFGIVVFSQGRGTEVRAALGNRRYLAMLAASAVMVAANWALFIQAVQTGHALQSSLGYYIFPLFAVALGYLVLGERFTRLQSVAIGLASAGVVLLTYGLGAPPWTAIAIAATFAFYGLIKNRLPLGPVVSVFLETLLLTPLALIWLWGMHSGSWTDLGGRTGGMFGKDFLTSAMLVFSGILTGGPLILFSYAARRIPYATLGLVQYLNPTLQFLVAVTVFGEHFTLWHGVTFALIWTALALYSSETLRQQRIAVSQAGP
jgi:chloramphenicol-sensitive protein RarD